MDSSRRDPSPAEWRRLHASALAYRRAEPWREFSDLDVFGVQDPVSGDIGWCSVLGQARQVFGLAVYRGSRGLALHAAAASGEIGFEEAGLAHEGWLVSFEDRRALDRRDVAALRVLDPAPRGRRAWPQYRSFAPGYLPWYVSGEEALYLAHVLEQAADVVRRFAGRAAELEPGPAMRFLVRVPDPGAEPLRWADQRVVPERPPEPPPPVVDELRLARLRARCERAPGAWQCAYFLPPIAVDGADGRPFTPPMLLLVEPDSGVILDMVLGDVPAGPEAIHDHFLSSVERLGRVPAAFHVADPVLRTHIEPLARALGARVQLVDRMPALDHARRALEQHVARGRRR